MLPESGSQHGHHPPDSTDLRFHRCRFFGGEVIEVLAEDEVALQLGSRAEGEGNESDQLTVPASSAALREVGHD